jgi:hypothetical protein
VVFVEDLTPILVKEMPLSSVFFSKKRKVVIKREIHQREGVPVKRHRILYDGHAREEVDFTTDVADSLGSFATANQFSVSGLKEKLKQKDLLVSQLQDKIKTVEQGVRNEMTKGFEQVKAHEKKEIQHLKISLDEMQKNSQADRELVGQLQMKISLIEKAVVEISTFQVLSFRSAHETGISTTKPLHYGRSCPKRFLGGRSILK